MPNKYGSKDPAKTAGEGAIARLPLDDGATRLRIAAELVEAMRDAGYDCQLVVEQDLHS